MLLESQGHHGEDGEDGEGDAWGTLETGERGARHVAHLGDHCPSAAGLFDELDIDTMLLEDPALGCDVPGHVEVLRNTADAGPCNASRVGWGGCG